MEDRVPFLVESELFLDQVRSRMYSIWSRNRTKPRNRTGEDVLDMVNDVKVIFGKGHGSQPVLDMAPL